MKLERSQSSKSTLGIVMTFVILFSFSLMVLSFPAGIYTVYFTKLSSSLSYSTQIRFLYLFTGPVIVTVPVALTFGQLFMILTLVYISFFVLASARRVWIAKALVKTIRGGVEHLFENDANVVMLYTGAVVFVSGVIDAVQSLLGVQTGSLNSSDPLETFLGLTVAALREEFGFRMLLIGTVAFLVSLPNVKEGVASLWRPTSSSRVKSFPLLFISAIAASSFLFGLAHYVSDSGWQVGKVSEATYAGLLIGYAYYRYGFHVAVLIHWSVDYFGSVYSFLGQGIAGIPWESGSYILSNAVDLDLIMLLGISGTVILAYRFFKAVLKRKSTDGVPTLLYS